MDDLLQSGDGAGTTNAANTGTSTQTDADTQVEAQAQAQADADAAAAAASAQAEADAPAAPVKGRRSSQADVIANLQDQVATLQAQIAATAAQPDSPVTVNASRAAPSIAAGTGQYIVNPRRSVEHGGDLYDENRLIELTTAEAERLLAAGFVRPARELILAA